MHSFLVKFRPELALICIMLVLIAFWAVFSFVISGLNPDLLRVNSGNPAGVIFIASIYLLFIAQIIAWILKAERSYGKEFGKLKIPVLVFTVFFHVSLFGYARLTGSTNDVISLLSTVNLIIFAVFLGISIVVPLKRAAELVPVCVVMALADLFSVAGGPTKEIVKEVARFYEAGMTGKVPFGDFLLLKIALPGRDGLIPIIGGADIVMLAFLCAAALKFSFKDNLAGLEMYSWIHRGGPFIYFPVALVGLVFAFAAAQILGIPIPALIILAAVFLIFALLRHPETRKMTASDVRVTVIFAIILLSFLAMRLFGF